MMIKKSIGILVLMGGLFFSASAQQKSPMGKTQQTESMATYLGLNASQKSQLAKLQEDNRKTLKAEKAKVEAATSKTEKGNSKSAEKTAAQNLKKAEKAYQQEVLKILTPEQRKKYNDHYGEGKKPVRK